jgi:hypothetical protein
VIAISENHGWDVALFGIAAPLHMRPEGIAPAVERRLRELLPRFERAIVVYAECGTRGRLDELLHCYNVPRIAGPHCYELYAGREYEQLVEQEPGTFFLTDFLVRGFRGTIKKGLGLDRFPELQEVYFGNYRRLVYLVQQQEPDLLARAQAIAAELGLPLEVRYTGLGLLQARLADLMAVIHEPRYAPVVPVEPLFGSTAQVPPIRRRLRSAI